MDSQLDKAERELSSFRREVERTASLRASVPIDARGAAQAIAQTEQVERSVNDLHGQRARATKLDGILFRYRTIRPALEDTLL